MFVCHFRYSLAVRCMWSRSSSIPWQLKPLIIKILTNFSRRFFLIIFYLTNIARSFQNRKIKPAIHLSMNTCIHITEKIEEKHTFPVSSAFLHKFSNTLCIFQYFYRIVFLQCHLAYEFSSNDVYMNKIHWYFDVSYVTAKTEVKKKRFCNTRTQWKMEKFRNFKYFFAVFRLYSFHNIF